MGGELFVGIKKDGIEHLMLRHTNSLPYWFTQPTFQSGGEALQEYIDMVDKPKPDSWICRVDQIQPSQYGIVLIDFDSNKVFSRQDYCYLDKYIFSIMSSQDEVELVSKLIDLNLIEDVITANRTTCKLESFSMNDFLVWFDKLKTSREELFQDKTAPGVFHIKFKSPFTFDQINDCFAKDWKKVKSFLKENQWKSKVWSTRKINEYYR